MRESEKTESKADENEEMQSFKTYISFLFWGASKST